MKGNLTRCGARSWRLKFDVGSDPVTGKRLTKFVTLKGTRTRAQATKILAGALSGDFVDPSRETVAGFAERWLRDWAKQNLGGKAFERYAGLLRKYVIPRVGGLPIQKLRAVDLQAIYAAMGDVSDATRLYVHRVMSRMLRHATQWGTTSRNVATLVDAPKARTSEVEILTPEQVNVVLEALHGHWLHPIAVLALGSGARRGELLGLQQRDLDLDTGIMRIERAVEQTQQDLTIKAPKTRHGRRVVTLAPVTIEVLWAHRLAQQELWLALGRGKVTPETPVFATIDGGIMSPRSISKAWERTTKRLGIKASFHSLRHTHASTLLAEGVDPVSVSRRLGRPPSRFLCMHICCGPTTALVRSFSVCLDPRRERPVPVRCQFSVLFFSSVC
jgi:integrase